MSPRATRIAVFDRERLSGMLECVHGSARQGAVEYVSALVGDGPEVYLDNAKVTALALVVDGRVVPLILGARESGNAAVCSLRAHYVDYTLHEFARRHPRVPGWLVGTLSAPLQALLGSSDVDDAVFVNNWLLTTNPPLQLTEPQTAELTEMLTARYPRRAIVFRSINPVLDERLFANLRKIGYAFLRARTVYLLDTREGRHLRHQNVRTDLKLPRQTGYCRRAGAAALRNEVTRLTELYRGLYLAKHTPLNPAYTEEFVRLTLESGFLAYLALTRHHRVESFASYFADRAVMTGSLIGYDRQRPTDVGLYRQAVALLVAEAAEREVILNLSAGAGSFKMYRGCSAVQEFDAVYCAHLPAQRRALWHTLGRITRARSRRSASINAPNLSSV